MTHPQPHPILQPAPSYAPWRSPQGDRLPGTGPGAPEDWIWADACFAPQMALRDRLVRDHADAVLALRPQAAEPALELLDTLLQSLASRPGYGIASDTVTRPDGVAVPLDRANPMATVGRLVQSDLCILQKQGDEHVLTAAALCFPAHWNLSEKIGLPLVGIHRHIAPYDQNVARRVQRMFDSLRPGIVLVRSNCLPDGNFALFQPHPKPAGFARMGGGAPFIRLERQTLRRLPDTGAVIFAIHTTILAANEIGPQERAELERHLAAKAEWAPR